MGVFLSASLAIELQACDTTPRFRFVVAGGGGGVCVCTVCVGGGDQTRGLVLKAAPSTSESLPHLWQVLLSVKEA